MLEIMTSGSKKLVVSLCDFPQIAVVKAAFPDGKVKYEIFRFSAGLDAARLADGLEKAESFSLMGIIAKKKLGQGEHHTPPKGYPTDRSQYAVPEFYMFPIDRKHIHAAISYFPHHAWKPKENKARAARRILRAAKRFGVKVSPDSEVYQAAKKAGFFAAPPAGQM
jgi:hypothetical protein